MKLREAHFSQVIRPLPFCRSALSHNVLCFAFFPSCFENIEFKHLMRVLCLLKRFQSPIEENSCEASSVSRYVRTQGKVVTMPADPEAMKFRRFHQGIVPTTTVTSRAAAVSLAATAAAFSGIGNSGKGSIRSRLAVASELGNQISRSSTLPHLSSWLTSTHRLVYPPFFSAKTPCLSPFF